MCSVLGCSEYPSERSETKFFRFPKDKTLFAEWVLATGRSNDVINDQARVCSRHFLESDWRQQDILLGASVSQRKLKDLAIPSQKLPKSSEAFAARTLRGAELLREDSQNYEFQSSQCSISKQSTESCRACLNAIKDGISITSTDLGFSLTYGEMLTICAPINISRNDQFPTTLCQICVNELRTSYNFRQKCVESERRLNSFTANLSKGEFDVAYEDNSSVCSDDDDPLFEPDDDEKTEAQYVPKPVVFPCRKCDKCFYLYSDLDTHNLEHPKGNEIQCSVCQKVFKLRSHLNDHIFKEHRDMILRCGYCDVTSTEDNMISHFVQHVVNMPKPALPSGSEEIEATGALVENNQSMFVCQVCSKDFRAACYLRRHVLTHDPDKPFHCESTNCKWSFATDYDLQMHVAINHLKDDKNECMFCQKTFKKSRLLRQHMVIHKKTKRFKCKYCEKEFHMLHHLRNHELHHTKDLEFWCSECDKAFATKDRLAHHQQMHLKEKAFTCDHCPKAYPSATSLRLHQRSHHVDPALMHLCNECGVLFAFPSLLSKHVERVHRKTASVEENGQDLLRNDTMVCDVCNHEFATNGELQAHMKLEHTRQHHCHCGQTFFLATALERHMKTHLVGDRPHKCTICAAGFNRPEHLKSHVTRLHLKQKPFPCSECGQRFYQSGELNIHMRKHTGERPFVCRFCSRGFMQSTTLRTHMRTHTGDRPYQCDICKKGHTTVGGLKTHMLKHTRKANTNTNTNTDSISLDERTADQLAK